MTDEQRPHDPIDPDLDGAGSGDGTGSADAAAGPLDPLDPDALVVDGPEVVAVETAVSDETVAVRRAPRYGAFLLAGGVVGVLVALILTFAFPENDQFDRGQVFGFLLLALGAVGVGVGALVALLVDRALARRSGRAIVEHESTHRID